MKKSIKFYVAGFLSAIMLLTSINVFADGAQEMLGVVINKVNVAINGTIIGKEGTDYTLNNGEKVPYSIVYNGTTYLPVRKVAELVGKNVSWNGETNTVGINDNGFIEQSDNISKDDSRIFSDINIEVTIRNQINKLTGEITKGDLKSIKSLRIWNTEITSLKGIEQLESLEELDISSAGITDISLLQNLKNLKKLNLYGNNILDISELSKLSNLEYLNLRCNSNLKDISALTNLVKLKELYITNTNVDNISPLVKNIQNGGFEEGIYHEKGYIMLHSNKLNLSDNTTLEQLQYIKDKEIHVEYIPQR